MKLILALPGCCTHRVANHTRHYEVVETTAYTEWFCDTCGKRERRLTNHDVAVHER